MLLRGLFLETLPHWPVTRRQASRVFDEGYISDRTEVPDGRIFWDLMHRAWLGRTPPVTYDLDGIFHYDFETVIQGSICVSYGQVFYLVQLEASSKNAAGFARTSRNDQSLRSIATRQGVIANQSFSASMQSLSNVFEQLQNVVDAGF